MLVLAVVPQPDVQRTARPTVAGALRLYRDFLGRPGPAMACGLYVVMYGGLGLLIVYLPAWISERFDLAVSLGGRPLTIGGLPVDFIAVLFFAGGVASVLVGPRAGALSDRLGRRPLVLASSVGLTLLAAALPFVVTSRAAAVVLYVVLMSLFAMRMAPLRAALGAWAELGHALAPDFTPDSFSALAERLAASPPHRCWPQPFSLSQAPLLRRKRICTLFRIA